MNEENRDNTENIETENVKENEEIENVEADEEETELIEKEEAEQGESYEGDTDNDEVSMIDDITCMNNEVSSKKGIKFLKYFMASLIDTAFSFAISALLMFAVDKIMTASAGLFFARDQIFTVLLLIYLGVLVLYLSITKTILGATPGEKVLNL